LVRLYRAAGFDRKIASIEAESVEDSAELGVFDTGQFARIETEDRAGVGAGNGQVRLRVCVGGHGGAGGEKAPAAKSHRAIIEAGEGGVAAGRLSAEIFPTRDRAA
jgi:hypothetical protein